MRPIQCKSHERPVTCLKYNSDGDIIFSCAKDNRVIAWYTHNGERLGTYDGHKGAIWHIDVDHDSKRLVSCSADDTVKLWEVETGHCLHSWTMPSIPKCVEFSDGDQYLLVLCDRIMGQPTRIFVYDLKAEDMSLPILSLEDFGDMAKVTNALFSPMNDQLYCAHADGSISVWSRETGEMLGKVEAHSDSISNMQYSWDGLCIITASKDNTARLFDATNLSHLKTYTTERPVNAATISPTKDYVVLGGGQEAGEVTTTSTRVGRFESRFFHKIYTDELGSVGGHFGPINALAFAPDGKSFVSGAEDAFVRIHHFDADYFENKL
eukprot:TRINITY_DN6456_c0_g1_i1.p1 TRINITY_DN6456_c0_g1~~TRINITY_DN6456_c0_g1_i1.p1  ORF type:complete len:323 (+),score=81.89 TRINITY_DN6456_c0_g1_i1:42-1010(+)